MIQTEHPLTEYATRAYIACALWSSVGEDEAPLDDTFSVSDVTGETLDAMRGDVAAFLAELSADGVDWQPAMGAEQLGHDLWLTRNHHGAGFWDRGLGDLGDDLTRRAQAMGSSDLHVGDDGDLYVM